MLKLPARPITVALLIELLKVLPPETLVCEAKWFGCEPLDRIKIDPDFGPLMVYEKDGEVRLYVDDHETWHEYRDHACSLFYLGDAFKRALKLR